MSILNTYFKENHCINLDRRPDRWQESQIEFEKHKLDVKRFPAFDGKDLPTIPGLTPGNVGAIYSHRAVLQYAKDKNLSDIFILEDDVEFHEDLNDLFSEFIKEVPDDWDIIFLGANHSANNVWMTDPIFKVSEHVYKVVKVYANHSYAVKNTAYDKLIDSLSKEDKPNDVLVADVQKYLNCYVFRPHLAWQRPSYSDLQESFTDYKFLKD